jgi:hypothetical protein
MINNEIDSTDNNNSSNFYNLLIQHYIYGSEEIRDDLAVMHGVGGFLDRLEDFKLAVEILIEGEDSRVIATLVAVVGHGPDRDE